MKAQKREDVSELQRRRKRWKRHVEIDNVERYRIKGRRVRMYATVAAARDGWGRFKRATVTVTTTATTTARQRTS